MHEQINLVQLFTDRFDKLALRYLITGSMASTIYGEPRLTNDVDIVLDLPQIQAESFHNAFPIEEFYCPPQEVIKIEISRSRRGHFNLIHHSSGFKADVYLIGDDPFQKWALDNCLKIDLNGRTISMAPLEYVIVKKLEFYREGHSEKHLRDIRTMFQVSRENIKLDELLNMIRAHALTEEWDEASLS